MSKSLAIRTDPLHAMAAASQTHLIDAVTRFGGYADRTGAMATSMKGLVISINRDIKRAYGMSRDDMPRDMLLHVSSALVRVVEIIEGGMRDQETRADIKRAVHAAIEASGASYAGLTGATHAQH
jgi:hypothetical protein